MPRRARISMIENDVAAAASYDWPGGTGVMYAEATWGGGSIKLQQISPNGTWMDVGSAVTFTTNGIGGFLLPAGPIRLVIATAIAAYVYVVGVPSNI